MSSIRIPECWICFDKGYVLYQDKDGYEFINHCNGRKCEKRPSQYYIPSVAEKFDVHELARDNLLNWWQRNKHRLGVKEALIAKGIQVERLPA